MTSKDGPKGVHCATCLHHSKMDKMCMLFGTNRDGRKRACSEHSDGKVEERRAQIRPRNGRKV